MLLAVAADSIARILATPGTRAACPTCRAPTLAKCGEIVTWHWAHPAARECDPWAEHETAWHLDWKRRFPRDWVEYTVSGPIVPTCAWHRPRVAALAHRVHRDPRARSLLRAHDLALRRASRPRGGTHLDRRARQLRGLRVDPRSSEPRGRAARAVATTRC